MLSFIQSELMSARSVSGPVLALGKEWHQLSINLSSIPSIPSFLTHQYPLSLVVRSQLSCGMHLSGTQALETQPQVQICLLIRAAVFGRCHIPGDALPTVHIFII